jgi:internalin A
MKQEDREALQKFGRMLGQPLKKTNVELEELHRISDYNYCYVENTEGHVVGISIRKTNKDYILHILAVFESLQHLVLRDNQISDLSPLKELHNLTNLYLIDNQISDLSPLKELHNLTSLSLSGNQISDLSPLKELHNLTSLNLGGNQISDLSPLKELHNLTSLYLINNQISDLSPLKELHNLTSLDLGANQISDLSPLKELHNLTSLSLGGNQISDLSPLKELHNLTSLNLGGNQISDLSPLKELHNLTSLSLSGNQISDLSPLKELHNLTSLYLGENQISDLSPLKELHNLTSLYLWENQISDLRPLYETIKANENIRLFCTNYSYDDNVFTFGDNPLDSPPKEIIEQGREEVLRYFESKELIEVNECKVLVVGEGESGKTTLIKRYLGEEIPDEEDKTDGIFIKQSIIKDIQLEDSTTKDITLNIWDFGGQEIYLQVHKFFLTEKSLYILVVSSRTDDKARKEIYDGLRLIKSYGGESSPIIVVGNKADQNEHFSFIDEKTLQEEGFTNPIFFCKLSAKFGNDFPEGNYRGEFDFSNFEKCLRRALPKVENITQKWPKEYIRIKNEIEKEDEKYISEEKFREICTQNNANKDYQQLAKLFNNLGTFTHFEDEDVRTLQELFITKPEWATNAVYDILGSRELLDEEKGSIVFDPATWHEIFKRKNHEDIYKKEHATYIKELIKKFYIGYECTKTNNQNILLIPSVLGEEQPDNDFDIYHADNLHVRIQYKTYFSYILPQLMARMHEDLTDIKWKGGAIFEKNGATAKVIANQYEERIDIFVQGTLERKRTYLNHIWETLEIIQKNIDKRSYEYLVAIDKKSDKEWEYENYEELLRLEARGKTQYITGKKDYSLSEILSGIKTKEQRIQEVHKYNFYGPINNPKFQSGRGSIQSEGGVIVSHGDDAKITQTNIWNNYGQAIALMENIVDSLEEIVRDKKFEDLQYSQRSAVKDAKNATEETIEILKNKDATEEKKKSTLSEWKNIFGEKIKKLQPLAIASTLIANAPKAMQNIDDAFKSILKYLS